MVLQVLILDGREDSEPSLSLDSPRVVIGRSKSCDVQLPERTVSARHASIRRRGSENLLIDEGSTNGTLVGSVKLPPQTPRIVRDGEIVRIGRIWLKLRFVAATPSPPGSAEALALDLLRRRLADEGEDLSPRIRVASGPDEGLELPLAEPERDYLIGRSREADLILTDENASRRHATVRRGGTRCMARDEGSKRGSKLAGEPLTTAGAPWRPGTQLEIGGTVLELIDSLPEALQEIMRSPDEQMRHEELAELPPGAERQKAEAPRVVEAPGEPFEGDGATPEPPSAFTDPFVADDFDDDGGAGFRLLDALVVLVALGVIGLSVAGLLWVFG